MKFGHKSVEEINILASAKFTAFTYQIPQSMGKEVDCRKIVPAGTVYPSNDGEAVGILLNDVDVTEGDSLGSVVVDGIFLEERLPEVVTAEAKEAMTKVSFKEVI